ncbi:hypothetical protein, partial [Pseudomonas syringae group genomosp. 7]|uniref:hypothetical protein n=1 Tax=Pseudomonas syringae group genomosp. 7 TaxID=251699 RepID=UPI00376F70A6
MGWRVWLWGCCCVLVCWFVGWCGWCGGGWGLGCVVWLCLGCVCCGGWVVGWCVWGFVFVGGCGCCVLRGRFGGGFVEGGFGGWFCGVGGCLWVCFGFLLCFFFGFVVGVCVGVFGVVFWCFVVWCGVCVFGFVWVGLRVLLVGVLGGVVGWVWGGGMAIVGGAWCGCFVDAL